MDMALVAVGLGNHGTAGRHLGAVHGEVEHLVRGSALHLLSLIRAWQNVLQYFRFHPYGVGPGGLGRNRVLESERAIAVGIAGCRRAVFAVVARSGGAAESGVAVVRGGTGESEADIFQIGKRKHLAVSVL